MHKKYNFSPLKKLQFINGWKYSWGWVALFILAIITSNAGNDWEEVSAWLFRGSIAALLIGGSICFIAWRKIQKHNLQVLTEFAVQNNLTFSEAGVIDNEPASLFGYGHSRRASNVFSGETNQLPFQLYNYRYTEGHGKYAHTYYLAMAAVELPHRMPQLIIDSLVETGGGRTSVLPINFKASQKITLEGDFFQYFALYAPEKHAVDALTVLAPDVMHTLLKKGALCDIEIVGRRLYFYWPVTLRKAEDYEQVLTTFEAVVAQLAPPLKRIRSSYSSTAASQVAEPAKLKRTSSLGAVIGTVLLVIVGLFTSYFVSDLEGILIIVIVVVILLAAIFQGIARRRRYNRLQSRYRNE